MCPWVSRSSTISTSTINLWIQWSYVLKPFSFRPCLSTLGVPFWISIELNHRHLGRFLLLWPTAIPLYAFSTFSDVPGSEDTSVCEGCCFFGALERKISHFLGLCNTSLSAALHTLMDDIGCGASTMDYPITSLSCVI